MGEVVAGAALGALLNEVVAMTKNTVKFKTELQSLKDTLEEIQQSVDDSSILLGRPPDKEMRSFISHLNEGRELVRKCSKVKPWNVSKYAYKLKYLDLKLRLSSQIETQTNIVRILAKLDELELDINAITHAVGLDGPQAAIPRPRTKIRQLLRELIKLVFYKIKLVFCKIKRVSKKVINSVRRSVVAQSRRMPYEPLRSVGVS